MPRSHGLFHHRVYVTWLRIRRNCSAPDAASYRFYGGAGISVVPRWNVFVNFLADMGEQPDGHTLARYDNDGDFSPENCYWIESSKALIRNRGVTMIEFKGEKMSVNQFRTIHNLGYQRVMDLHYQGLSPEEILSKVPRKVARRAR